MRKSEQDQSPLKVSIITATHNAEQFLKETIDSVVSQLHPNIEYIIVDNHSVDKTMSIIEGYPKNIDIFISEPDEGIYDAFNKGVSLASGDVIFFLNSDDFLYDENVIFEVVACFEKNPNLLLVYGNVLLVNEKSKLKYIRGKEFTLDDLKTGDMPPHQGFFVKKKLLEKIGFFDTQYKIAGDFDFIIRCFKEASEHAYYFNRTIAVFREGGVSTGPEKQQLMNREQQQIIQKHFGCERVPNLQLEEINGLYKVWLEKLLLNKKGITHCLHEHQINNIAIYGTMKTALFLYEDLKQELLNIVCFLDNNQNMQGRLIEGVPVYHPKWVALNQAKLDLIILSIEGRHDLDIIKQLQNIINQHPIKVCTWKELAKGKLPW